MRNNSSLYLSYTTEVSIFMMLIVFWLVVFFKKAKVRCFSGRGMAYTIAYSAAVIFIIFVCYALTFIQSRMLDSYLLRIAFIIASVSAHPGIIGYFGHLFFSTVVSDVVCKLCFRPACDEDDGSHFGSPGSSILLVGL